jgi:hypothetical protein
MTDREMIVELGEEINRLKSELHAFTGLMMEFRVTGLDGRQGEPRWREGLLGLRMSQVIRP